MDINKEEIAARLSEAISDVFDKFNIDTFDMPEKESIEYETIKKKLSDIAMIAAEHQESVVSEKRKKLGKVFTVEIEKGSPTAWIFDKFSKSKFDKFAGFDTVCLKNFCYASKRISGESDINSEYISARISIYIKDFPLDYSKILNTRYTMTDLKKSYCEIYLPKNEQPQGCLGAAVYKHFLEGTYDKKGDVFFENSIEFKAQNNYNRDSGFGRSGTYYIVGANITIFN